MIHFELIFLWYEVGIQLHSFACGYPVVPAPFVEKTILSSTDVLALLSKINVKLFLDSQFYFIDLYVYHSASTTQS